MVESDGEMEIDLLCICDPKAAPGVENVACAADEREFAHILGEQKAALAQLSLDHNGRLVGVTVHRVGWRKKVGHHARDRPAAGKLE
jgi:hypothetical protein